ncbi:MAG TPA: hypothetical protein VF796_26310 [Humisphaera sp.]
MALELRPTFTIDLAVPCAEATDRLRAALAGGPLVTTWARLPGASTERACDGTFVWVAPPAETQRLFSPWLQLSISPAEAGGGTKLFGRFSPRPDVWTAFALSYLLLTCVTFFGSVIGLSQVLVRHDPWAFWVGGAAAATLAGLYAASQIGQRLAAGQMTEIRAEIEAALGLRPA